MQSDRRRYRRVLGWFILALVAIQGLGLGFIIKRQQGILFHQATRQMGSEIALIGNLVREPLLRHDYITVVEFLQQWGARNGSVAEVRAVAPNGFVLAEYAQEHPAKATAAVSHVVRQDSTWLATLHVVRDLAELDAELKQLGLQLALIGLSVTAGLGWVLWVVLAHFGLRPLREEIRRRQAVETELRTHRDQLDQEVTVRTRDLQRTVDALRNSEVALTEKGGDLEATNLELQQLVYVISHDLKGPLRAISQLASVLDEDCEALSDEARATVAVLRSRVQRMHSLIDSLLAYSQAGRHEEARRVDCGPMVWEILESLPIPEGFAFNLDGLPALVTDHLHLRQVLANLINNAIDHHDRQTGHVEVTAREIAPATWEFAVSDDGPGIAAAYREKVFEVFQTLTSRDRKEHSGMGLSLVKRIVENRGGRVSIDPAAGRGTTIRFTWHGEAVQAGAGAGAVRVGQVARELS